jgi:DNA-binding NarL/FixJ family response regulator
VNETIGRTANGCFALGEVYFSPEMAPKKPIRILLVDDHSIVRSGLAMLIGQEDDFQVVAEADDAEQAVACFRKHRPDVTLMDVRMPGADGIEAMQRIRAEFPDARVVMLTTYDLDEDVFRALDAGAVGYLLKTVQHAELFAAVRRVHGGERCVPKVLEARLSDREVRSKLTPREVETLDLLARGFTNREIGTALGVSERTAKAHVEAILAKLEAADRAEAVDLAYKRGLLRADRV